MKEFKFKSVSKSLAFLALFIAFGVFLHSCTDDSTKSEVTASEEPLTEADLMALYESTIGEDKSPKSTNEIDLSNLNKKQKEIISSSQLRFGNCDPEIPSGPQTTDGSRSIFVSNTFFTANVDYDYRYLSNNGGVSILNMTVTPNPGFWANNFLLIDDPDNSPYSSSFNKWRGYMYAFIASAIENDVVAQPGVFTASPGNFIFFNVNNKLLHNCWGTCTPVTCCQRYAYYWSPTGLAVDFDRYYDSNGYAFIDGASSTFTCSGTGSNCGPAGLLCNDISMGFNSLQ